MNEFKISYCPNCGSECKTIQKFCMNCGASLVIENDIENETVEDDVQYVYQEEHRLSIKLILASVLFFLQAALLLWVAVNYTIYQDALLILGFDSLFIFFCAVSFAVIGILAILLAIGILRQDYRAYIFGIIFSIIIIPFSIYFGYRTTYILFWFIALVQFVGFIIILDEKREIDKSVINENEIDKQEKKPSLFGNIATTIGILLFLILMVYAIVNIFI